MEALHKRTLLPDPHDEKDHFFRDIHGHLSRTFCLNSSIKEEVEKARRKIIEHVHNRVDLRVNLTSEIINQGLLNSCSACAIAVAAELYLIKDGQPFIDENASNIDASQMFIYYNERVMEDKVDINAPVYIRDGIKSLFDNGICSEKSWPYPEMFMPESIYEVMADGTMAQIQQAVTDLTTQNESEIQAAIKERPSTSAVSQAKKHIIKRYCKLSLEHGLDELKLSLSNGMPFIFGIMVPRSFYGI